MSLMLAFALACQDKAAAEKALDEIAASLKEAAAVGFELSMEYEGQPYTSKVWLKRPNLARTEDGNTTSVLDGKTYWSYSKQENQYMKFDQVDEYARDFASPISNLYFGGKGSEILKDAESATVKTTDDEGRLVSWRVVEESFTTESKIWTDKKGTIVRIATVWSSEGEEPYEQVQDVKAFTTSPKLADDAFAFAPPEGATESNPNADLEESLLAAGADAPDFEAPDLDDKKLKLSSLKGKVVLLNFWFYG